MRFVKHLPFAFLAFWLTACTNNHKNGAKGSKSNDFRSDLAVFRKNYSQG